MDLYLIVFGMPSNTDLYKTVSTCSASISVAKLTPRLFFLETTCAVSGLKAHKEKEIHEMLATHVLQ